jgi:hypothetical protein
MAMKQKKQTKKLHSDSSFKKQDEFCYCKQDIFLKVSRIRNNCYLLSK